jgi:conjugal transfer mating pair stabilization protein TraG
MDFQFVTFGNGEILKGVLDAIVMCLNAETGTLYTPMIRVGMMVAVFWTALCAIWGDYLKIWGKALIPFVFIPPLLFVPSARVNIYDAASNYQDDVAHVPLGLAWLGHFVSQFGYEITKQVDQVFSNVDDLKYHKSGFLMASNLIQQARTFRITNEDVAENMRQFVCQCVAYEAMLGYKYTLEDLRHTSDLWGLVSANPSKIRSFVWRDPHSNEERKEARPNAPEIISCQEGVKRLNLIWAPELNRATTVFGIKLFGSRNPLNARQEFLKYLPISYGFLSGLTKNADQIMKQQMMIHSVVDGIEQKSVSLGNAPNFAARRAYLQQRSTYETLGAMASESLLTMKAVLEAIVYASFIFVVPLAVLPFGVRILLSWAQTLIWLQMWAPLYAVLNFIMSMTARSKSIGMLSVSNPEGITIASSVGLMNLNADMSAMAGFLAMSVPFLAIALVKGVGSFVHMASHLGNVSQGVASQAAGEAVTGNYSFGNVSTGNEQIANTNMLSQSRAASYRAGAFQFVDGRTDMTTMGDGEHVVNIGTSNLPVGLNMVDTISTQETQMATLAHQRGLNHSENSSRHLGNSLRNLLSLSNNLAASQSMNDGVTQGVSSEQSRDIQKGAQLIHKFAVDNNITDEKAAEVFGSVTAGGGVWISASAGGKASVSAADRDLYQKAAEYTQNQNFHEAIKGATQASENISHTVSDEASRRLAADVSGSYEKGMNERSEASKSFSESEAWSQQAMNTKTNAASLNASYNQQYIDWLADQHSDNTTGRIGHQGAAHIIARRPEEAIAWGNKFMAERGLTPQARFHTDPARIKDGYTAETRHQVYTVTNDPVDGVNRQASSMFTKDLTAEGKKLRENASQTMDANDQYISKSSSNLSQEGSTIRNKVTAQQGRYVTKRVVEKVAKEGKGILEDVRNIKGDTADALKKMSGGGPQQK